MLCDAHCHFFSEGFFSALSWQRGTDARLGGHGSDAETITRELGWEAPGTAEQLADRWVRELDAHGVTRVALIGSVSRDEETIGAAVARHPTRFVGFFMADPSAADATTRVRAALEEHRLSAVCLFPAMHHVPLDDPRTDRILDIAAAHPGTAVFVHCGVLSVGVRHKLGLASRFDVRLGNPLELQPLATAYPDVPFIVPHFGAGFFRETLMLADMRSNVYLDTSSSNSWIRYTPGLTLEAVFRNALDVVGASRLLFGTDSSYFPRGWQKKIYEDQRRALDALKVSPEDQTRIFGANFDRLFPRA